jgi:RNA polymerase sigma factor (sigma-70 family)
MAAGPDTLLRYIRRLVILSEPGEATDAALLARFLTYRDEQAFTALVDRHGPLVLQVCRRILGDAHDAEDAFQATFLVLARKADTVHPREALPAWLHGVARRVALKARAARIRRSCKARPLALPTADPRPDPLAELSARELLALLDEEVRRLPEKYRLAVILCCLEGRSQEEVAQLLGWTPGSVKGRLERGRVRLHERLVRRGLTLSIALSAAEVSRDVASAAVVAGLAAPTVRGALAFAARPAVAGSGVPPGAAALARDVIQGMALANLKLGALLLLALGLLVAAAGVGARQGPFASVASGEPTKPAKPLAEAVDRPNSEGQRRARLDAFGDPLPEGAIERWGTLRFRPGGGSINRLLLTPDGQTLISSSYYGDRTVCVWEVATGKLVRQFPGHYEENGAVALSPDGKELAIGQDAVIHFYELSSGGELRQVQSPLGATEGLAFSPDGRMLASGHARQTLVLWELSTTATELARFPAGHNSLSLLAFSSDGRILATSGLLDKTIRLFDVASRTERPQLTRAVDLHDWVYAHNAFAFAPRGSTLAVGVQGGSLIRLLDAATGKRIRDLHGAGKYIAAIAWSPDGKILAASYHDPRSGRGSIHLWDMATGTERQRLPTHRQAIQSLTFTPDCRTLVGGGIGVIRLWDLATGQERGPTTGFQSPVWCLAQSPDGRTLALGGLDWDAIRLWDRTAGREVGSIPGSHSSFAFSPDGKVLAAIGSQVGLWDVAGRRLIRRLQSDPKREDGFRYDSFDHPTFSPDGKLLAAAGAVGRSRGGVNVTDDAIVQLWDTATGKQLRRFSLKDGADDFCTVDAVAFSPDGKTLIASGQARSSENSGSKVRVWEVATGKQLARLSGALSATLDDGPFSPVSPLEPEVRLRIACSPDGTRLAMNRRQPTIPVCEAATGRRCLLLEGHQQPTVRVVFSPDGRTLASSSLDGTIRLWDLETGKELRRLTGHRGKVESLLFSADGRNLISAGEDTTILFWDVAAITQR